MQKEVLFPKLSEKIENGVIISLRKEIGEEIHKGEILYEVETDKAVHEIESTDCGIVLEFKVEEGDTVTVGDVIGTIDEDGVGKNGCKN